MGVMGEGGGIESSQPRLILQFDLDLLNRLDKIRLCFCMQKW